MQPARMLKKKTPFHVNNLNQQLENLCCLSCVALIVTREFYHYRRILQSSLFNS